MRKHRVENEKNIKDEEGSTADVKSSCKNEYRQKSMELLITI